jgi:hypothetical protein
VRTAFGCPGKLHWVKCLLSGARDRERQEQADMSAFDDFIEVIKKTETMQGVMRRLEREPAELLSAICREYEETNEAVPDHHLNLAGYFCEAVLKALVSADLLIREPGDRYFLYSYRPTEEGLKHYRRMLKEKTI